MKTIEFTMDDLYLFLQCPLKYKLTKIHDIENPDDYKTAVLYSKGLHQTIAYFFYEIMQGKLPTLRQMRDKWSHYYYSIFEEDKRTKDNFLQPKTGIDHQRTSQILHRGMEAIYAFYEENKDQPGLPIAVNYPFRLPIKDKFVFKGEFELIRERTNEQGHPFIEVVDFKTSPTKTDAASSFFVRHDLRATSMYYAFRHLFQEYPDQFLFDYIGTETQVKLYRDKNEIKRFLQVVNSFIQAIEQEDYYPRQSFMCKNCSMIDYCDRLQF